MVQMLWCCLTVRSVSLGSLTVDEILLENMSPLVRKPKAPLQDVDNCMLVLICDMIQAKETTSAWSLLC